MAANETVLPFWDVSHSDDGCKLDRYTVIATSSSSHPAPIAQLLVQVSLNAAIAVYRLSAAAPCTAICALDKRAKLEASDDAGMEVGGCRAAAQPRTLGLRSAAATGL